MICDVNFSNFVVMKKVYHPNAMDLKFTSIKKKKSSEYFIFHEIMKSQMHSDWWIWCLSLLSTDKMFNYMLSLLLQAPPVGIGAGSLNTPEARQVVVGGFNLS